VGDAADSGGRFRLHAYGLAWGALAAALFVGAGGLWDGVALHGETHGVYVPKYEYAARALREGRLPLYAQSIYAEGVEAAPKPVGEAPYVTFVQDSHALGLSPPGTWIRIPWTPQMANVTFMMSLRMRGGGVIKPRQVRWFETLFTGERHQFSLSFNEVRDRPLFPMYAEHRDRAIRLADAPAELVVHFTQSEHLRIEQVYPPTSMRRLSESLESTEVVSLFMGSGEGIVPQTLTVQFGYFSRTQGVMIVLIPLLLLAAGPALGPVLGRSTVALVARLRARLHLGVPGVKARSRESGVLLEQEVLNRIVPGKTSRGDVLRLCGPEVEEEERRGEPDRSVLVYRGWRAVPETRTVRSPCASMPTRITSTTARISRTPSRTAPPRPSQWA